jgi:hypothetical protein
VELWLFRSLHVCFAADGGEVPVDTAWLQAASTQRGGVQSGEAAPGEFQGHLHRTPCNHLQRDVNSILCEVCRALADSSECCVS